MARPHPAQMSFLDDLPRQTDMAFEAGEPEHDPTRPKPNHEPASAERSLKICREYLEILARYDVCPWDEFHIRYHTICFGYGTGWQTPEVAAELRAAFAAHAERLNMAADPWFAEKGVASLTPPPH